MFIFESAFVVAIEGIAIGHAPGQSFNTTMSGTSVPFATARNGKARFTVESDAL